MIRKPGLLFVMLAIAPLAIAGAPEKETPATNTLSHVELDRVGRISFMSGIQSWTRVDDDTVIIWANAFRPFLVDLSRKANDLRFADTLTVTSTGGQILEKFDSVIVDGIRYPIEAIYKLDRESADNMQKKKE